jgi:hypothetical protein
MLIDMKNIWINVVENQPKATQNDQTNPNTFANNSKKRKGGGGGGTWSFIFIF